MISLKAKAKRKPSTALLSAFGILTLLFLLVFSTTQISTANDTEQLDILTRSVSRSITACYALEGAYPPNVRYLVENYGLTYDSEQYFIDYQYIGANLRPDVTILKKDTPTWYD